jgi:hypothetical protein
MVADAGPNLVHAFTLTPAFHITVGPYAEGQLVTPATVAGFPALDYATTTALTATLTPANTWSIAAG